VKVQVVLPGATAANFWSIAGKQVEHLPQEIVMSAEDIVDAARRPRSRRVRDDSGAPGHRPMADLRRRASGDAPQFVSHGTSGQVWDCSQCCVSTEMLKIEKQPDPCSQKATVERPVSREPYRVRSICNA
jgi:hypothetical protein